MRTPTHVLDCETNGLLDTMDRVHLLQMSTVNPDDPVEIWRRNNIEDTIEAGLRTIHSMAQQGAVFAMHNGISFDRHALRKVYPWFILPEDAIFDTLVWSRLRFSDIKNQMDAKLLKEGTLPGNMYGRHSLESWGYRLGVLKGEYDGDTSIEDDKVRKGQKWEKWNQDMEDYGIQDIVVTRQLLLSTKPENYSPEAIELEHQVAFIIDRQERYGFKFNEQRAAGLLAKLSARREELTDTLVNAVPAQWWPKGKVFVPKRDNKARGYTAGVPVQKMELRPFNPTSRAHIARMFKEKYDWKPVHFTPTGDVQIDDEILADLPFPESKDLGELFTVTKRIGLLQDGTQALLKVVKGDGRIHGRVNSNGAVTGRMTHSHPNVAGTPKVGTLYGHEFRDLYEAAPGMILVGADAAGIELRNLAHFMAKYDKGAYAKAVVEGSSADMTDAHSLNTIALGMDPKKLYTINGKQAKGRDVAKTFIYAFLYGAGPDKLGYILGVSRAKALATRKRFLRGLPALEKLIKTVGTRVKGRGYLIGLDGRVLPIRHAHAALNTLLQSAGAVIMKKALVLLDGRLNELGHDAGETYEFVANVHDEWQIECDPRYAEMIAEQAVQAIRDAGEHYQFRCPMDGEAKIGPTWAATH